LPLPSKYHYVFLTPPRYIDRIEGIIAKVGLRFTRTEKYLAVYECITNDIEVAEYVINVLRMVDQSIPYTLARATDVFMETTSYRPTKNGEGIRVNSVKELIGDEYLVPLRPLQDIAELSPCKCKKELKEYLEDVAPNVDDLKKWV
jgi:hypothetical protein